MISVNEKVEQTIRKFVCEFIEDPYICYTEHGQHARFYQMLYEALDPSQAGL
jgi:lipopolysaccharide biosynthesis regulator YciM